MQYALTISKQTVQTMPIYSNHCTGKKGVKFGRSISIVKAHYHDRRKTTTSLRNAAFRALPVILRTDHERFDEKELARLLMGAWPGAAFDLNHSSSLRTAMQNSLVTVGAFVPRWTFERVIKLNANGRPLSLLDMMVFRLWSNSIMLCNLKKDLVMIGCVRAVGDAALVATLHDIVVHPQVRRMGVGKALLGKVTRELYDRGIIDVGVLLHGPEAKDVELFLGSCGFGDDTEHSVAMVLSEDAIGLFSATVDGTVTSLPSSSIALSE